MPLSGGQAVTIQLGFESPGPPAHPDKQIILSIFKTDANLIVFLVISSCCLPYNPGAIGFPWQERALILKSPVLYIYIYI